MTYQELPQDVVNALAMNAGILLSTFNPASPTPVVRSNIIGATSGGVNVTCVPTYSDLFEDLDNAPKNTKEGKHLDGWDCKMSGTMVTASTAIVKLLLGAATINSTDSTKVTPDHDLALSDFTDIWYVCDYGNGGGFVAIRLINALSTGGFSLQSTDNSKGQFSFEFTGHSSTDSIETIPMEFYVKSGNATMTYNSNGGTGTMTDSSSPYTVGSTVTVKANTFTYSGKTFVRWNTKADGTGTDYAAADTFTINENTTLYAQWSTT